MKLLHAGARKRMDIENLSVIEPIASGSGLAPGYMSGFEARPR